MSRGKYNQKLPSTKQKLIKNQFMKTAASVVMKWGSSNPPQKNSYVNVLIVNVLTDSSYFLLQEGLFFHSSFLLLLFRDFKEQSIHLFVTSVAIVLCYIL